MQFWWRLTVAWLIFTSSPEPDVFTTTSTRSASVQALAKRYLELPHSYYLPGNLIENTKRDKVAEDRLNNMVLPVVFSDSVPAKTTWAAGLHIIYLVIIFVLFRQDAFSDMTSKCGLKHFIFPLKQLSHKQIILH